MNHIKKLNVFIRSNSGIAAVEFALCLPALIILLLGAVEVSRYIILNQKLEKIAYTMSDVVAQTDPEYFTTESLDQLVEATENILSPFVFGTNGIVYITSVTQPTDGVPTVNWRYTGGGTLSGQSSQLGSIGSDAILPNGLTLNDTDNVIIAEVYYTFVPMFTGQIFGTHTLYKVAIYKPRLGELTDAPT